jgi:hypothetical protein
MTEQTWSEARPVEGGEPVSAPAPATAGAASACCAECASRAAEAGEHFIYSLGRLDVRFPALGVEREFQQRERLLLARGEHLGGSRWPRIGAVLRANNHLARAMCVVQTVGGLPAYLVRPNGSSVLAALLDALQDNGADDAWDLVIGHRGPIAGPAECGGLVIPTMLCDAVYSFTLREFQDELRRSAGPVLGARRITAETFDESSRELFQRIAHSIENIGGLDSHRALNFLLVQHPGIFLAAAERVESSILDSIETRVTVGPSARRVVSVILTFVDRATAVPERLFTRVDVTEEWPFIADSTVGGAAPLGLEPYIEHGYPGMSA